MKTSILIVVTFFAAMGAMLTLCLSTAVAQLILPPPTSSPAPPSPTPTGSHANPSWQPVTEPRVASRQSDTLSSPSSTGSSGPKSLPNDAGQIWREYDIRQFTNRNSGVPHPEQSLIDWVLRETGTDMWFSDPVGVLSANQDRLLVYHTSEVQETVAGVVERFVRAETQTNAFGVRLVTISSPNWRVKAQGKLRPVNVQTPGVEAWLISREDAAVLMADLRRRTDFREHNSPNLLIYNGQSHTIERTHPLTYIRGVQGGGSSPSPGSLANPGTMDLGQAMEGFSLQLSPLLSEDKQTVDAVIHMETNQVEKLTSLAIPTPTASNPRLTVQTQVPQTSSWRLHERFRWPATEVLLISCGVVAAPGPERPGLGGITAAAVGRRPPRADALLMVESKGNSAPPLSPPLSPPASPPYSPSPSLAPGQAPAPTIQTGNLNYRGRY